MQHDLYDRLLGILCSVLDAYSAALFLPNEKKGLKGESTYQIASVFSLGNKVDHGVEIAEGKGLVGWILRNQEPLLVANFDQHQSHLSYYMDNEEQSIKAFMGCPLPSLPGALCVDSKRQYSFSEKDQKLLHLFAGLASCLCSNVSHTSEQQEAYKYFEALQTIYELRHRYSKWDEFLKYFLYLMSTITGFSYCTLCTRDAYGEGYMVEAESSTLMLKKGVEPTTYPMTNGIVGWVFRNGSAVMKESGDGAPETPLIGTGHDLPHFPTVMALPLVIQRKTRGVLCFAHDFPMPVSKATKKFANMATEHLSLFLENLYVKCRLRDLHNQQRTE